MKISHCPAHAAGLGEDDEQPSGVVDDLRVSVRISDSNVDRGCLVDLVGEVGVEEVTVDRLAEQPRLGRRVLEFADRLDQVDAAPAVSAIGEPNEVVSRLRQTGEGLGRERPECVRQQTDRVDQRAVLDRPDFGQQASVVP